MSLSSLLAKRLSFSHHHHHHLLLLTPVLRLPFSSQPLEQKEIPLMAKYLISSFGFSPVRALKYSAGKHFTAIKSLERPEAVIRFLSDTGLSDTQIKAVVSFKPYILACNVEKALKPKLRELMDAGFSKELLIELIRHNPDSLRLKETISRLHFWRDFGKCDQYFLKIIQKNRLLVTYDIKKFVLPRVNLFNEYGFSNQDMVKLLVHAYGNFVGRRLDTLREILQFIEELGIPRESRMFLLAFKAVGAYNKDKLARRMEFFKVKYGLSQEEVSTVFKKYPVILSLSTDNIKSHMDFLIQKAKLDTRIVTSHPFLLGYSLEKRLVPRHNVLSILAAKGLKKDLSLSSVCYFTERRFREKFVEPYKKDVPELVDAYFSAAAGNTSA
jgi:mTERF domain-containing protein, mitochondrial